MYNVQSLRKNNEILELLMKWRCLSLNTLKELLENKEKINTFRQKIYRLEKEGIIKSQIFSRASKVIYPSDELIRYLGNAKSGLINEDNIRHDAVVSLVTNSFLKLEIATEASLPHEYQTKSTWKHHAIEPDAILKIPNASEVYNVALEVELWRKDRKRIYEKIIEYAKAYEYDYIFYFFGDEFSFNSYTKRLHELMTDESYSHLKNDLIEKFILIYDSDLTKSSINLLESKIYHNNESKKLSDLLGK